jgi:3-hydroxybutyryl-CoA dehydrogenase
MNILVIGEEVNFSECQEKFGKTHRYVCDENPEDLGKLLKRFDLVFDFTLENSLGRFKTYAEEKSVVFINTTTITLSQLTYNVSKIESTLFGFCGLPTLLNRPQLEVSLHQKMDEDVLKRISKDLSAKYLIVPDTIGLITPRIICMIINEAYYTIEEGIASPEDIDVAMKLGTNYPLGPFEWCKKIGVEKVCSLLESVYHETCDERYKISALLKAESFK